jgi:nitrite reductase/ring-hydroxylating ferredoxin subunit/uncharacterized membrane protein
MELLESLNVIEDQTWLDPTGDQVQKVVTRVLTHENPTGKTLDDLLNGVWLGHPLHPVLTDIPIGAWTVGLVLDAIESLSGREDLAPGADAATVIGLGGALGAAVTGLAQWQYTIDRPRRLGLGHALLNVAATTLYGASALLRVTGKRGAGKTTALVGYGIAVVASYIGGDLVYGERLGVTHVPEQQPPDMFTPALPDAELPEGKMTRVMVGGAPVLLARQGGQVYALAAVCAHLGGPLEEGTLGNCDVTCPWHASRFALDDGRVLDGPATFPQPTYETRIHNGQIEVQASTSR